MSDTCPVVRIKSAGPTGWAHLDEHAFDPDRHELWVDPLDHDGDGKKGGSKPASDAPDGTPTPIPEDWETMHHTKQINLAKALAGDFTASEGQTMTEKSRAIIAATVADRANPPAKE